MDLFLKKGFIKLGWRALILTTLLALSTRWFLVNPLNLGLAASLLSATLFTPPVIDTSPDLKGGVTFKGWHKGCHSKNRLQPLVYQSGINLHVRLSKATVDGSSEGCSVHRQGSTSSQPMRCTAERSGLYILWEWPTDLPLSNLSSYPALSHCLWIQTAL